MDLGLRRRISKHGILERQRRRNREGKAIVLLCRNAKGEAAIYRVERGKKVNHPPRFTCPLCRITSPPSKDRVHAIFGHALEGYAR